MYCGGVWRDYCTLSHVPVVFVQELLDRDRLLSRIDLLEQQLLFYKRRVDNVTPDGEQACVREVSGLPPQLGRRPFPS